MSAKPERLKQEMLDIRLLAYAIASYIENLMIVRFSDVWVGPKSLICSASCTKVVQVAIMAHEL